MMPETVAQPLDRRTGGEDRPFQGVGDAAVGERPGDGRQHALRRWRARRADVEQHEAARAVGVLGHARLEAGLAEQRRLLVTGDAADRDPRRRTEPIGGDAHPPARCGDRREAVDRHVQQIAELLVPAQAADVEQHRATGVGGVGGEDLPAGEVPDQPGVDRAERQVLGDGNPAWTEQPLELRAAEVGVEDETRALAYEIQGPGCGELVAAGGGTPILPDDGPPVGLPGGAIPRHDGLPLVGDPDRRHGGGADLLDDVVQRRPHRRPDLGGVVLDPARSGEVLGELAVRGDARRAVGEDCPAADAGGAGIDGDDARHRRRPFDGRFGPLEVRRVGAGRGRSDGAAALSAAPLGGAARGVRSSASVLRW